MTEPAQTLIDTLGLADACSVASAHTNHSLAGHFLISAPPDIAERLVAEFGKPNPAASWGEVQIQNQELRRPV